MRFLKNYSNLLKFLPKKIVLKKIYDIVILMNRVNNLKILIEKGNAIKLLIFITVTFSGLITKYIVPLISLIKFLKYKSVKKLIYPAKPSILKPITDLFFNHINLVAIFYKFLFYYAFFFLNFSKKTHINFLYFSLISLLDLAVYESLCAIFDEKNFNEINYIKKKIIFHKISVGNYLLLLIIFLIVLLFIIVYIIIIIYIILQKPFPSILNLLKHSVIYTYNNTTRFI